jgi:hypothetical protein
VDPVVVVVVTVMSLNEAVVIEGVVTVVVVVVALWRVAVSTGVGADAVQATGKKLLHARKFVVNAATPNAVQLPATQALVPLTPPKQPTKALDKTVSMGFAAVYGTKPDKMHMISASSPCAGSKIVIPKEAQVASIAF